MSGPMLEVRLADASLAQQVGRWLTDEGIAHHLVMAGEARPSSVPAAGLLGTLADVAALGATVPPAAVESTPPLIVLGDADDWSARALAVEHGASGFVGLPLAREALLAVVSRLRQARVAPPASVLVFGPDGPATARRVAWLREQAMAVDTATDPAQLFSRLAAVRPDVLLILPGLAAAPVARTLRLVRSDRTWDDLTLLVVVDDAAALAGLPAGASVLVEPVAPSMLARAVADRARSRRERVALPALPPLLALQDQERRALDAHALVSIADADGRIVHANDLFCATSGYRRDELLGRNHRIVKSGQHPAEVYARLWSTIARGGIWQGELCNRRKDGGLYWVATTIMPTGDDTGTRRYLSIRTDITAAKQVQQSLRRRVRQQRALAALSRRLMACDRVQLLALLPRVLRLSARLLDATHARWVADAASPGPGAMELTWPSDGAAGCSAEIAAPAYAAASGVPASAWPGGRTLTVPIGEGADAFGRMEWQLPAGSTGRRANDDNFARALVGLLAAAWSRSGAQLAQRASDQALQDMLHAFPGIVAATDDAGIIRYANDAFARLLGHETTGVIGLQAESLLPAATAAALQRLRRHVERQRRPVFIEHEIEVAGTDASRHFAVVHFASGGRDGVAKRLFLIGVDISERRRTEQQLQQMMTQASAEGRLQALLATAATDLGAANPETLDEVIHAVLRDAGSHFEADRAYLMLAPASGAMAAWPHEWCADGVAPRREALSTLADALTAFDPTGSLDGGQRMNVPDIEAMPPEAAADQALLRRLGVKAALRVPVSVQGSVMGGVGFDAVRMPRHWPDAAMRALALLGQMLGNAVHRVRSERALRMLKEQAEAASAAKSDFLASMSHELRTPMNAVLGFGQLLELTLAAESRELSYVQEILKGGRHLLSLIDDVLDLARIESGRVDLSLEPIVLADIVAESIRLMRPLAERRDIAVTVDVGEFQLMADRVRLKQVLVNLVSNAVKYNVDGGRIDIRAFPAGPGLLRVEVCDSGPGIALERQHELFQPFNRLGAEAGPVEGTGIGLMLVRQLVELMGGCVGVDSAPGRGSAFWFELPLPHVAAGPAPTDLVHSGLANLDELSGKRVLYIDDNPPNLRLMESILARWPDVQLLTAQHPQLGLELAEAYRPDLVLLDIQMAPLDGFEVLRRMRRSTALATVPVAAITANAMPRDLQRLRDAGFDACLTKPFEIRRLMALLEQHLRPPAGAAVAGP